MQSYIKIAHQIEGWFDYKYICPLLEIINRQQNTGHILEIGVHHGKSFIPMTLLLKNKEIAVALDVFEDQQFNYDKSGKGCSSKLKENIEKVYGNDKNIFKKIKIIKEDSTKLKDKDYLKYTKNTKYRIISIDGCHTKNATLIDLNNAINILTDDGIIILDDYFNKDWPGVRFGVDTFMEQNKTYRLIYLNANKFILCNQKYYSKYMKSLRNLPNNIAEHYEKRCWIGNVFLK